MKKVNRIIAVGGDMRQVYALNRLNRLGFETAAYALPCDKYNSGNSLFELIDGCDAVVFPLPVTRDGKTVNSEKEIKYSVNDIISHTDREKIIFGGLIDGGTRSVLIKHGCKFFDYYKREDVTSMNVIPTAQGVLKTLFNNIDFTVFSSNTAVFGYGRTGKYIADIFQALGANVTVCARKEKDIQGAKLKKLNSCHISDFEYQAEKYDIIINTVPAEVINEKIISELNKNCIIIDISSAPYGTDFSAAEKYGIKAVLCPSLPGRTAPKTAGEITADGIVNIMKENGYA